MELIGNIFQQLSTRPEFGYFILGVIVGMWLIRFILQRLFTIITISLIGLVVGTGIINSDHIFALLNPESASKIELKPVKEIKESKKENSK